jgi:hypothetical protein
LVGNDEGTSDGEKLGERVGNCDGLWVGVRVGVKIRLGLDEAEVSGETNPTSSIFIPPSVLM